tara:strand:+ start:127 stop:291 length:165 start_codon:yes stop_codon:yes gene_type:complete
MKKTLKYIGLLLLAMKFIRPNKNNGVLEGIIVFKNIRAKDVHLKNNFFVLWCLI